MQKFIIAIDGYSSCGKSTTAKKVAAALGYAFIDTGAMYRAVCYYFLQHSIDFSSTSDLKSAIAKITISFQYNSENQRSDTFLNGKNVESEIREMYISDRVSEVSAIAEVRKAMVFQQQKMGEGRGVVMDGRDIGTKVFPGAEVKVFMTADPIIRAKRRQSEYSAKGKIVELDDIIQNIKKRDILDTTREETPLRRAEDAVILDTSYLTISEQVAFVIDLFNKKQKELQNKQK